MWYLHHFDDKNLVWFGSYQCSLEWNFAGCYYVPLSDENPNQVWRYIFINYFFHINVVFQFVHWKKICFNFLGYKIDSRQMKLLVKYTTSHFSSFNLHNWGHTNLYVAFSFHYKQPFLHCFRIHMSKTWFDTAWKKGKKKHSEMLTSFLHLNILKSSKRDLKTLINCFI